ncbi:gypsy/ty3 retroelement polyprotein, partial [Tanacetum coccineum]
MAMILLVGCIDVINSLRWMILKKWTKRCSTYEDHMSQLKNIRQKGGLVQLYIDAFDVIMTKVEIPEAQAYVSGHKCSGRLFSLEIIEGSGELEEELGEQFDEGVFDYEDNAGENVIDDHNDCHIESNVAEHLQISLNAILGANTFQTMRVKGQINNKPVNILIDCGSTHNFLDVSTAKQMGCSIKESYPLQVTVPGGNFLTSNHVCKGLTWKLQGETFQADMMLVPLGVKVILRGVLQAALQWMQGKQLGAKLFSMALCVYPSSGIQAELTSTGITIGITTEPNNVHSSLSPLLHKYEMVFAVPKSLPPHRRHDHRIPLQDTTLINISHFQ